MPEELVRATERLQQNLAISVPTLSQVAAEAAFDGREEMEAIKHGYEENRQILLRGLPAAGFKDILPVDGAFYLYADTAPFSDDSLAFAPDYGALLAVRRHTDLPLVFDPSHSTGRADAVAAAAVAATAFGADGLLIESHIAPERCYQPGDGAHMYPPERIAELLTACAGVRDGTAAVRTAPLPSATSRL